MEWFRKKVSKENINYIVKEIEEISSDYLQLNSGVISNEGEFLDTISELSVESNIKRKKSLLESEARFILDAGNSLEGVINPWNHNTIDNDISRYRKKLQESVAESYQKEKDILSARDLVYNKSTVIDDPEFTDENLADSNLPDSMKIKTIFYSEEQRRENILKGLEIWSQNSAEVNYHTNPAGLVKVLKLFRHNLSLMGAIDGVEALIEKTENVLDRVNHMRHFEDYFGEVDDEVFAETYSKD